MLHSYLESHLSPIFLFYWGLLSKDSFEFGVHEMTVTVRPNERIYRFRHFFTNIAEMFIHFSFTFNAEGNKFKLVLFFHKILLTTFHVIEIPLVFSTKF